MFRAPRAINEDNAPRSVLGERASTEAPVPVLQRAKVVVHGTAPEVAPSEDGKRPPSGDLYEIY